MSEGFQDCLIKNFNRYLKANNRELTLERGYCHGLTLLWLNKMDEGKEVGFYALCKQVLERKTFAIEEELIEVEKIIAQIEWLQNPNYYSKEAHQSTIEKVIEVPREFALSYLFDDSQLKEALKLTIKEKKMICFSSLDHSIGIYQRGNDIYLFNANYKNFPPVKVFSQIDTLQKEIIACLEDKIEDRHGFIINVFSKNATNHTQEKMKFFRQLVTNETDVDISNKEKTTILYLACDNLDKEAAALLIKKDADPNKTSYKKLSPLELAVDRNDLAIAKVLLKQIKNINQLDSLQETHLIHAIKLRYEKMVELLLKNGADPFKKGKSSVTPFQIALKLKEWPTIILLLRYAKNIESLKQNVDFLLHRNEIIDAAKRQWHSLSLKNKVDLKKKLESVFNMSSKPLFFKQKKKEQLKASPFSLPYSLRSHTKV